VDLSRSLLIFIDVIAVLGVDFDAALASSARELTREKGLANAEIMQADARRSGLPSSSFDLVHARTLLVNVPDPGEVVAEMARLAKPGGWVASMEPDLPGMLCHPPHRAWERLVEISAATYRSDGADLRVGRRVPGLLREAGLTDVAAEARADFYPPGHSRRIASTKPTQVAAVKACPGSWRRKYLGPVRPAASRNRRPG
jgi:SAM-dependent methyltransferase